MEKMMIRRIPPVLLIAVLLNGCLNGGSDEGITDNGGDVSLNNPPVVTGNPPSSVRIGDSYTFQPTATDPDGDSLTFEVRNLPNWAEFDADSARITGLPLLGHEGVYSDITVIANDGLESGSLIFSVTVTTTGAGSVTLSWAAPTANEDGIHRIRKQQITKAAKAHRLVVF